MYHYSALVTCLAIAFYFFTTTRVASARAKFGVKVPATSGHPDFERVFRVQMNTLEWMPIFLPSLWLFAVYISDPVAAALGLVWIAGRFLYWKGASRREAQYGLCRPVHGRRRSLGRRARHDRLAHVARVSLRAVALLREVSYAK